jgi:mediator of RNA polymerase II transcription subunit 6
MTSFFSLASSLPLYSPTLGHHYLSPGALSAAKKAAGSESRASRAQSEMPRTPAVTQGGSFGEQSAGAMDTNGAKGAQEHTADTQEELRLISESLRLAAAHKDEYMDANPIQGEPGSFVFKSSIEHLKAQQQAQQQVKAKAAAAAVAAAATPSGLNSSMMTPLKTQGLDDGRKGSLKGGEKSPVSAGVPKKKKKTGKGNVVSPGGVTPA